MTIIAKTETTIWAPELKQVPVEAAGMEAQSLPEVEMELNKAETREPEHLEVRVWQNSLHKGALFLVGAQGWQATSLRASLHSALQPPMNGKLQMALKAVYWVLASLSLRN